MGLFKRNKEPDGVPGRAVIVYYGGQSQALGHEAPSSRTIMNVKADVQVVGGDGTVQGVKGRLPGEVWWLLEEGQEIDVRIDPSTGTVIGFDRPALEAAFAPRVDELKGARKRQTTLRYQAGLEKEDVADLREAAKDLRNLPGQLKDALSDRPPAGGGLSSDDPSLAPIEGVDFDTWIAVQAAVVQEKVKPADHDALAQRHGVAPGRWPEVQSAWQARMQGNPGLAQRFGEAYQAALRG